MYGERKDFGMRSTAPVNVGDEMEVKIEAVGEKGDGIAKKEGFVIFVPNTQQGDSVRIRVTKVLRKVGFGEVVGGSSKAAEEAPAEGAEDEEQSGEEELGDSAQDSEDFGEEAEEKQE